MTTIAPLARFRKTEDGRVQLRNGDMTALAEESKTTAVYLSRVLNGHRKPSEALRTLLEAILGVPLDKVDPPRRKRSAA